MALELNWSVPANSSATANPITGTGVLEDTDYHQSESGKNLKFALSYQLSRSNLVYATAAEGFRPGGLNVTPGLSEVQQRYAADHLWSYEIGARIAAHDFRIGHAAIGKLHADLVGARDHMVVGDDMAQCIDDDARPQRLLGRQCSEQR